MQKANLSCRGGGAKTLKKVEPGKELPSSDPDLDSMQIIAKRYMHDSA